MNALGCRCVEALRLFQETSNSTSFALNKDEAGDEEEDYKLAAVISMPMAPWTVDVHPDFRYAAAMWDAVPTAFANSVAGLLEGASVQVRAPAWNAVVFLCPFHAVKLTVACSAQG